MSNIKEAIDDIDETRKIIAKIWNTICDKCNVKECRKKKLSASLMDCKTMMQFNACRTYLNQVLAKLRTEQPPAGELMKEAIELDKMCVSEIVAKYESSHNAITVLKRKLREACESDEWRKSATEFYENGGCPICFSTDEAGCTEGCYLGQLQERLDRSEASRKELLTACENLKKIYIEGSGNTSWMANYSDMDAAIKAEKEVKK